MSQTQQLVGALKQLLRARGYTYAQVADHLGLSEASVKRQFSQQRFTLDGIEAICTLLGIDFIDLAQAAERDQPRVHQLAVAQEEALLASPRLLLTAVCVLNHWTLADIVAAYRISEPECIQALLQLDKLGMIRLLPENRVRLRVARDFAWLPDGPIQRFFRSRMLPEFLDGSFGGNGEHLRFQHAMLSTAANRQLAQRLDRLMQEFAELHEDSLDAPLAEREGTGLLVAVRSWEPALFAELRRSGIST